MEITLFEVAAGRYVHNFDVVLCAIFQNPFKPVLNVLLGNPAGTGKFYQNNARIRCDAAIKPIYDTPPVTAQFIGLHKKASVIDRKRVYIGSLNLDPRSMDINTEMAIIVESEELAGQMADLLERDMHPDNAWQVKFDKDGDLIWVNSDETVTRQPAQGAKQRFQDALLNLIPIKDQL